MSAGIMIVSDLHLGDPRVDAVGVLARLRAVWTSLGRPQLIVAGDCIEGTRGLSWWPLFQKMFPGAKLVGGNHDPSCLGLPTMLSMSTAGGLRVEVWHGHTFSRTSALERLLQPLATRLNWALWKLTGFDLQSWFRRTWPGRWLLLSTTRRATRLRLNAPDGPDYVVVGHSHVGGTFGRCVDTGSVLTRAYYAYVVEKVEVRQWWPEVL